MERGTYRHITIVTVIIIHIITTEDSNKDVDMVSCDRSIEIRDSNRLHKSVIIFIVETSPIRRCDKNKN